MPILSGIYSALSKLERYFFKTFDFLCLRPKAKVVSIGNLSMGGTGKTPVLFQILEELQEYNPNKKLAVLTRGYRCPWEKGFYALYGSGNHPFELTDEALMLNNRFPNIPILVGKNRYHSGIIGEIRFNPDLFFLDDGFQYRRVHKDFNIILWDAMSKIEEARLIPYGRLREPIERLKAADVILLTRCESATPKEIEFWEKWLKEKSFNKPVIKTINICEKIHNQNGGDFNPKGKKVLAFSGIGRPKSFYSQLESLGCEIAVKKEFRDHHRFSLKDLEKLHLESKQKKLSLVCTEKDAVKIKTELAKKLDINVLKIKTLPLSGKKFIEEFENLGFNTEQTFFKKRLKSSLQTKNQKTAPSLL